jgi:hypothetical protein
VDGDRDIQKTPRHGPKTMWPLIASPKLSTWEAGGWAIYERPAAVTSEIAGKLDLGSG